MEHRQASDSPLTEADIELFNRFYVDFLGKRLDDPMSFLKAGTLLRRGDLRNVMRETMALRAMFEQAMPNVRQRDLLLSFPGVLPNLHSIMFDLSQSYGAEGVTVQVMKREQVEKHLDGTEMFRLDIDKAMEDFPSLPTDDRQALLQLMKARPGEATLRFLLVILADHLFLVILPGQPTETTPALGRLRRLIETQLGEKADELIVEFFTVGGGYIRRAGDGVVFGGSNPLFDPIYAVPEAPAVKVFQQRWQEHKLALVKRILAAEMPELIVAFDR
ncbi:MAG: hypothetical protein NZ585_11285 [Chloracidobacterium sp.]|nr:hypothetical protein [Chloracidobacterium sp.]MDW8218164.1 hypothetical protein [Acidobacteriota bacterium]